MVCDECGAAGRAGLSCRQQWDELLALEFSDIRAGAVHFLTVACYQLQHPQSFPLSRTARQHLADALRDVVVHGMSVVQVRSRMGEYWEGAASVRADVEEAVAPQPWSRTVTDVGAPDPDAHQDQIRAWAASVCADLDRWAEQAPQ